LLAIIEASVELNAAVRATSTADRRVEMRSIMRVTAGSPQSGLDTRATASSIEALTGAFTDASACTDGSRAISLTIWVSAVSVGAGRASPWAVRSALARIHRVMIGCGVP